MPVGFGQSVEMGVTIALNSFLCENLYLCRTVLGTVFEYDVVKSFCTPVVIASVFMTE